MSVAMTLTGYDWKSASDVGVLCRTPIRVGDFRLQISRFIDNGYPPRSFHLTVKPSDKMIRRSSRELWGREVVFSIVKLQPCSRIKTSVEVNDPTV